MELLRAENLSCEYDYPLFENVNLHLNECDTIAILGISGCGKSTLLHALSTLLKPKTGEVIYKNRSIYTLNDKQKLDIRRNDFGIIFQLHYLFKGFSALENIELASVLNNKKLDKDLCEKLQISNVLNQKATELSGGQQQRVSIARVLNKEPKIIFADEPTGNLDKATSKEVMSVLFDYVKEKKGGLILVTHDELLASKCSQIYRLENRQLQKWS